MRRWRLVGLVLLLAFPVGAAQVPAPVPAPAPAAAGRGIIRGVVTAGDTGRPIRGADVRLTGGTLPFGEPRWVRSDEQGRYEARDLQAGAYLLTVSKLGYLTLNYGQTRPGEAGRPVQVSEGATQDGINFVMPRGGVIVARVTDSFGDPLRGIIVRPLVPGFFNGERRFMQAPGSPSNATDDRGEVRLYGLAPGEYHVLSDNTLQSVSRDDAPTFYPGTLDPAEAAPVRLRAGEEVTVTFSSIRVRPGRLRGVIIGSDGQPLANPQVSFARPSVAFGGSSRRMVVQADGSFDEQNLLAGEYVIHVQEPEFASVRVRVYGDDIDNLVVTTRKPASIKGRVTFEGPPPENAVAIRPAFLGTGPLPGLNAGVVRSRSGVSSITVEPADDWTFEATIAGTGVLRLATLPSTPAGWFLKAVRLDGRDVTDTPLDFSANYDGKPVEVVLTRQSGTISGTVADARGQVVLNCTVVAFPESEAQWTPVSRHITIVRPDQDGRFALSGLPPGRYLIAAADYLAAGEERIPETLARLRASAVAVTLDEGESRAQNLRLDR
jgi:hypothetical protein